MGKIIETRKLYKDTLKEIGKSPESWQTFLDSSSWNFKYDFDDQILIYAQKPDARACATMSDWNEKLNRWVNSQTAPIYVFEKKPNSIYPFKLVFDLSDTNNYNNTEYKLWSVEKDFEEDIIESLEANFGDIGSKENLPNAIINASYNMVIDNIEDYLTSIINYKSNSMLAELSDDDIRTMVTTTVWASVSYMMMTRCGINAREHIQEQEFAYIKYFNNKETLTVLGASISDIAEMGLREIAKEVTILQKTKNLRNHTFAKNNNKLYPKDNEKVEGGIENGRENTIHETGRLLYTEPNNEKGESTSREIRPNEIQLPIESQEPRIDNISDGREINGTFDTNTRTSQPERTTDNRRNGETGENNRRIESTRPNEMVRVNEQHKIDSRGNSSQRDNLRQLEETVSQKKIVTEEEQKSNKDYLQDKYTSALLSNIQNLKVSKNEIKEFYKTHSRLKERSDYLKQVFSDAYTEIVVDDVRLGYKTYENVLHLWKDNYLNRTAEVYYKWDRLAEYIEGLILVNEFNDLHKPIPSVEDQMQILQVEAENAPTFSFTQEIIDYALQGGGNVSESKMRIYNQFEQSLSSSENIKFLKNEYGWGGSSSIHIGTQIGIDYDGKGIKLRRGYKENDPKLLISWDKVEKRIKELIKEDRYLNPKEKEEYSNWLKEQDLNKELEKTKKQLIEEEKNKTFEERLLNFYKEYDIFDTDYSEDVRQDLNKLHEQLKDSKYIEDVVEYLNQVKKAEDKNVILLEQIDYFVNELQNINIDNKEQQLAKRINNFIKDFEFYNYIDNTEIYRSNEDNISVIKADIADTMNIRDYVKAIKKIINDVELDNERLTEANDLLEILQQRLPKYEYHLGDKVYIGTDEYEIAGITNNIVTLYDPRFPIFTKQMEFEEFEQKVQENYSNSHLISKNKEDNLIEKDSQEQTNTEPIELITDTETKINTNTEIEPVVKEENLYKTEQEDIQPKFVRTKTKIQDFILHPEIPINDRNNYQITDNDLGTGTPREKFTRNIEAIKVLKKCEKEDRYATPEEQIVLSKYIGWGGLAQAFDEKNDSWASEYNTLKDLLNEDEYKNARSSTLTAFYTPPIVINAMYEILQNMGLKEANILEPSCRCWKFLWYATQRTRKL